MSHAVLRIDALPDGALDAAREFHAIWVEHARQELLAGAAALTIVVPPTPYDHTDWRRAAVRDLASAATPARVNMIAGEGPAAIASALGYLDRAPGVTGQYLPLDGEGAGNPAR
jgi:hypothetical protein